MSLNSSVDDNIVQLLETTSNLTEILSSSTLDASSTNKLVSLSKEFGDTLKAVHTSLDQQIEKIMRDDIPQQNNSYQERDELEVSIMKANYMLQAFK